MEEVLNVSMCPHRSGKEADRSPAAQASLCRLHIWGIKFPGKGWGALATLLSFCLYSKYFCWKPVIYSFFYFFFKACWFFWCLALEALLERSVSGSEHVVVFSFVMPWVLWTSWGRYCVEGDQQRDCGPANRLHAQVLDNLFSQSFPWVYLGPRPREKAQHGCQVTS